MDIVAAVAWVTLGFVALLGGAIIWHIFSGKIDLTRLISEPTGDASMSRLQLLIFTFVIALSMFLIVASSREPTFPEISGGVLTLLGISASSYLVSKGIQFTKPEGIEDRPPLVTVKPSSVQLKAGESQTFRAEVSRTQNKEIEWAILPPGAGSIDPDSGVYTAPDEVPRKTPAVIIQAVSVADASAVGTATVHLVSNA